MKLPLLFAWRYFKAKKSTNAINIIAWVSTSAIIVGTTSLILLLSVFNGMEGLVKSLYSTFYTDLKVMPASGKVIRLSPQQLAQLRGLPGIRNLALVVEEKAFIQNGEYQSIVALKGVDENYRYVTGVADHLVDGSYDLGNDETPRLIVGAGVESALNIQADKNAFTLRIYLPKRTQTQQVDVLNAMNDLSADTIRTAAAFMIQQDFDNKYAITNIDFVKRSLQMKPDEYSGVEIATKAGQSVTDVQQAIQKVLGPAYSVQTRYEQNRDLYSVMNMERWITYAVLSLILVVAAFNMIGALTMLVLEKQKDIQVLHALGSDRSFIRKIFLAEGMLLALIGCGLGMLLAVVIAELQIHFHLIPLNGGSFLIDYFPVTLRWIDFVLVGATVFVIALIASSVPSRKAARQEFSLRSE